MVRTLEASGPDCDVQLRDGPSGPQIFGYDAEPDQEGWGRLDFLRCGVAWRSRFSFKPPKVSVGSSPTTNASRGVDTLSTFLHKQGKDPAFLLHDDEFSTESIERHLRNVGDDIDLLYVRAPSQVEKTAFSVMLDDGYWRPGRTHLPAVAVFDTPQIEQRGDWARTWNCADLGPRVRLILGLDGFATANRDSSRRGRIFVEEVLKRDDTANESATTYVHAWFTAVERTSPTSRAGRWRNPAVAIVVGDSEEDVKSTLDTLRFCVDERRDSSPRCVGVLT